MEAEFAFGAESATEAEAESATEAEAGSATETEAESATEAEAESATEAEAESAQDFQVDKPAVDMPSEGNIHLNDNNFSKYYQTNYNIRKNLYSFSEIYYELSQ